MNKVICNICGTSYPENVSECPICGFTRSSDHSRENRENTYTHVPGGRFSKSNVRKRNQSSPKKAVKPAPAAKSYQKKKEKEKTSVGLIIVVILLLLAIVAVVGYIALRFFLPNDYVFEGLDHLKLPAFSQEKVEETEPSEEIIVTTEAPVTEYVPVTCEYITLDQKKIACEVIGETYQITYQLTPEDAEEEVLFSSDNTDVATVDDLGLITVVGEGSAVISVTCGSASAQCEITCTLHTEAPTEEAAQFTLNRKEITFTFEGESWLLYDGPVNVEEIVWTSDDNKVATIEDGKVFAVGNGDTTVYAFYDGQTVTCSIHCKFEDRDATETTGNVSEADGNSSRTYKLYNPHGRSDDVTTKVGKQFKLRLVDEYKNTVTGVEWSVEDPKVCSYEDGIVKALAAGTTKVIATYDGRTYSCIVRVSKK